MLKKPYQQYEIGQEDSLEEGSVEIDLKKYKTLADLIPDIPRGLTKVQEEIWKLKQKKKK